MKRLILEELKNVGPKVSAELLKSGVISIGLALINDVNLYLVQI